MPFPGMFNLVYFKFNLFVWRNYGISLLYTLPTLPKADSLGNGFPLKWEISSTLIASITSWGKLYLSISFSSFSVVILIVFISSWYWFIDYSLFYEYKTESNTLLWPITKRVTWGLTHQTWLFFNFFMAKFDWLFGHLSMSTTFFSSENLLSLIVTWYL